MGLYGWALALWFFVMATVIPLVFTHEREDSLLEDAGQTDCVIFSAYANHVREIFRTRQEEGTLGNPELAQAAVLGLGGNGSAGEVIEAPASLSAPDLLTPEGVERLGAGNVLIRDAAGAWQLLVWAKPDNPSVEAAMKRMFMRDGSSTFYVRRNGELLFGTRPGEAIPLAAAAQEAIPDRALVLILRPVITGPSP